MKFFYFFILSLFFYTVSCTKENIIENTSDNQNTDTVTIEELLTKNIWRHRTVTDVSDDIGYFAQTSCFEDSLVFNINGNFNSYNCVYFDAGNWSWIELNKKIEVNYTNNNQNKTYTYTILEINDTILNLRVQNIDSESYMEYEFS